MSLLIVGIPKMEVRLKWTTKVIAMLAFVNVTDCFMRYSSQKSSDVEGLSHIQSFKRGQFKRLQKPAESLAATATKQEISCNDAYYTLWYLHRTNPLYYKYPEQVKTLQNNINTSYREWARKILATAFNVTQNDTDMEVPWLMYLYVKWIEVHVAKDQNRVFLPVMKKTHYGMYKVMLCTMFENDCTMFDRATKTESKFTAYVADMKRSKPVYDDFTGNWAAVRELLNKHWPDLYYNSSSLGCWPEDDTVDGPVPGVRPMTEEHLTLDLLYLKDVFENTAMATTLLTDFGVFEDRDRLIRYLEYKMTQIKSGCMSFQKYVLSLVDFHEHVLRALNTMMLRILYDFLEKLKTVNQDDREKHLQQFFRPYNDWCVFLHLPKSNPFHRKLNDDNYFTEETIKDLQQLTITILKANDNMSKVALYNHTAESLKKINIDEDQLMITVKEYEIPLDLGFKASLQDPTRTNILCAEVLIGLMKKIFDGVHFKAIHSLVKLGTSTHFDRFNEYGQQYHANVYSLEDETHSIQVCGNHTILLNSTNSDEP